MKTIYLAGPIAGCSDAECRTWREEVAQKWPGAVLNPLRRDYRWEVANGQIDSVLAAMIVENDKEDIRAAHGVLVYWDRPSVGTSMEIIYAHSLRKPIVVIMAEHHIDTCSPWIWHHASELVTTIDQGLTIMRELLK